MLESVHAAPGAAIAPDQPWRLTRTRESVHVRLDATETAMRWLTTVSSVMWLVACGGGGAGAPTRAPAEAAEGGGATRCMPSKPTGSSLEVMVLGSGGPVPGARASASHAVLIDGVPRILVDAGPGAAVRIGEAALETDDLAIVLFTHLHVDHAGDLPGVIKARDLSHDGPLAFFIAGPEGRAEYPPTHALVEDLLGPHGAFAYLARFRNPIELDGRDLPIGGRGILEVLERPGLRITAIATDHGEAPAVAYRIEHGGHAVVFGGDTTLAGDAVTTLARGADLFVANATVLEPPASPPALYALHAPPALIGEVARNAHVGAVVLAHLTPAVDAHADEVLVAVRRMYPGPVAFSHDCLRVRADGARP